MKKNKKNTYITIGILFVVAAIVIAIGIGTILKPAKNIPTYPNVLKTGSDPVQLYKSMQCGCCGVYVNYLKNAVGDRIQVTDVTNIAETKNQYHIPKDMESCHTTVIGDYVIEGHVPIEAINKLLSEKPNIVGIAMPGMPSGSPGMPGSKSGDFVIYAIHKDSSTSEFMRI